MISSRDKSFATAATSFLPFFCQRALVVWLIPVGPVRFSMAEQIELHGSSNGVYRSRVASFIWAGQALDSEVEAPGFVH